MTNLGDLSNFKMVINKHQPFACHLVTYKYHQQYLYTLLTAENFTNFFGILVTICDQACEIDHLSAKNADFFIFPPS